MSLIMRFMRFFFNLLYHPFAFAYDLVAWVVSFGRWKDWVFSTLPHLQGTHILELGHGPGHLQRLLLDRGLFAIAIDESTQMGRLAKRRLGTSHRLTRGISQSLPFPNESFDCVVATFPTEYIYDQRTLAEVKRVLRSGGRLVVLPVTYPKSGFLQWLYKITRESPAAFDEAIKERLQTPFQEAGFVVVTKIVELASSRLIILLAEK
jgi:ubiquinone/menaquinone biosynthesis C-methylase UbiE